MDHAIAVEPVVAPARLKDRIRSVAEIGTVEILGNLTDDSQIISGDFSRDRRIDTLEKRILAGIDLDRNLALDLYHDAFHRGFKMRQAIARSLPRSRAAHQSRLLASMVVCLMPGLASSKKLSRKKFGDPAFPYFSGW